ncbi:sensor histidine kinase [Natroniella sulfidigena]|uniref:ATP-binding protein n=1 Tax=Natroniella sulfidigena TaxID=723921 RepID=UPI00200AA457|nr:sensor histidine kinase [Natroniella sulfidigena]MCK8817515.1 sensor histidine kinase [Natroniella sulfidigena]
MKFKLTLKFKIMLLVIIILNLVLFLSGVIITNQISKVQIEQLEEKAMNIAKSVTRIPSVAEKVGEKDGIKTIQPVVDGIRQETGAEFVVVMDMDGIRYSHPVEDRLDKKFVGGDEERVLTAGESYISQAVGTLGTSKRAFAPIYHNGEQVGAVAVGILVKDIEARINSILRYIYLALLLGDLLGIVGSILLANNVKKSIFGLEPIEIATILEEKNAIIDSLKEGVIAIDRNKKITLANKEAKKILNCQQDMVGKEITNIIKTTRLPALLETGQPEFNQEQVINDTVILTNRIPIKVENKVVGAVASFNKKDEVQELAEELTGVKKFVAALRSQNHEFMNQLHTISGLIQLEEYDEALSLISKVSLQKQQITSFIIKNIKVNEIAGLLLGKFDRASELKIDFTIDRNSSLERDYPEQFRISLITIIGNLLENAIESLASVEVNDRKLYLGIFEKENSLEIIVRDTGLGISKEQQRKIFERGFSTKGGEKRGIGLDLIKRNVELFTGQIELESDVGQGAEFRIEFSI